MARTQRARARTLAAKDRRTLGLAGPMTRGARAAFRAPPAPPPRADHVTAAATARMTCTPPNTQRPPCATPATRRPPIRAPYPMPPSRCSTAGAAWLGAARSSADRAPAGCRTFARRQRAPCPGPLRRRTPRRLAAPLAARAHQQRRLASPPGRMATSRAPPDARPHCGNAPHNCPAARRPITCAPRATRGCASPVSPPPAAEGRAFPRPISERIIHPLPLRACVAMPAARGAANLPAPLGPTIHVNFLKGPISTRPA